MSTGPLRILLVEDNPGDADLVREALDEARRAPYELCCAELLADAVRELREKVYDVVLLDLSLPDAQGLETVLRVQSIAPEAPVVVLTGLSDEGMAVKTVQEGAQDYLVKGELDGRSLVRSIRYAIERKRAEQAVLASERQFRAIFEGSLGALVITDRNGRILEANPAACELFGFSREELIGLEILPFVQSGPDASGLQDALVQDDHARGEIRIIRRDGTHRDVEFSSSAHVLPNRHLTELHDITERKRAEAERARLLASEQEKTEQLRLSVREAHHRIKNNLQAISDLLYLELTSQDASTPEEALRESMDRVQAIALVHDLLSQDEDVRTADTREVIERLVPMVMRSNGLDHSLVDVRLDVPSLRLSSKRVTTLALIVNELVSNAAKHAFPDGKPGHLTVSLRPESEELVLRVNDDGAGLPAGFDLSRDTHVGLDVVTILAQRDLNGRFTIHGDGGVQAEVRFAW